MMIGVHGGYHFEAAALDATDSSGRNISVLVPFDVPVAVSVQSNFFKLQDGVGNTINKAGAVPVTASSVTAAPGITVKIVGKN